MAAREEGDKEVMMPGIDVIEETDIRTMVRLAPLWRILIHNDPETTFRFVVDVLTRFFGKEEQEAVSIAWEAHTAEVALVRVVPREEAEFLVERAVSFSRGRGFPLAFTAEPCE